MKLKSFGPPKNKNPDLDKRHPVLQCLVLPSLFVKLWHDNYNCKKKESNNNRQWLNQKGTYMQILTAIFQVFVG